MAYIVEKCPHCLADHMSFKAVAVTPINDGKWIFSSFCPQCQKPVAAWLGRDTRVVGHMAPQHVVTSEQLVTQIAGLSILNFWPKPIQFEAPKDLPTSIERIFLQAEDCSRRGAREAAGMAYRRALELAMKDRAPTLEGSLARRIDEFARQGSITVDVAQWAHLVRQLGNEAVHDEGEPTDDDVADLGAFTRVMLEYLFTLPERVKRRLDSA